MSGPFWKRFEQEIVYRRHWDERYGAVRHPRGDDFAERGVEITLEKLGGHPVDCHTTLTTFYHHTAWLERAEKYGNHLILLTKERARKMRPKPICATLSIGYLEFLLDLSRDEDVIWTPRGLWSLEDDDRPPVRR